MGNRLIRSITSLLTSDRGVTAIEYGLIAALIAVAIIAAMSLVGAEVKTTFDIWTTAVRNAVQGADGPPSGS
ncbi:MAG: Flp family type IVb pilin [Alphaproteobacteria bacterium]|nr:Flp family type IVb pilin [Alphaproteobacteria bacterium]